MCVYFILLTAQKILPGLKHGALQIFVCFLMDSWRDWTLDLHVYSLPSLLN